MVDVVMQPWHCSDIFELERHHRSVFRTQLNIYDGGFSKNS